MARPGFLDESENAKNVAELFVAGASREEMAQVFQCSKDSITNWRKDPRVKAHSLRLIEERAMRVKRKTDSEIERRLQDAGEMTVKELLAIRSEFGGSGADKDKGDQSDAVSEALEAFERDPELAAQLAAIFDKAA